ncbi:MAG TPA: UDP-N-acetylmuramoyl-L-alanyl-D-glutamate--2,6-diaminopimelate ligase [Actinomycetota bacterium]|nr:UDP-N-acetylmuramoyl-L-alanyl-D-glutamate--2,6-diaminopimelate ligase [Actinomycetota bacterium]
MAPRTEPQPAGARSLADLAAAAPHAEVRGDLGVRVTDVTYRSQDVLPGALFFCVRGDHVDGHDFAPAAADAGAAAVVAEREVPVRCAQVLVPSVREAMGPVSAAFFGNPSERFPVAGVTGTNGKTTTTYLLEAVFDAAGATPGVIGTTGVRIAGEGVPFERTTPEACDLQRVLARMAAAGVRAATMEVSSHGLDQHRVDGTRYACALFTNLSQDHLDYHGTMEAYFQAKARLFTGALSSAGAVNVDTPEGERLATLSSVPTTTFGIRSTGADVVATDVVLDRAGLSFHVDGQPVRSRLRGPYNAMNCLGAFVAARLLGIADDAIARGIESLEGVPGRLEAVDAGQPFTVVVDYAHTPDSLENVLRAVRELASGGRVIVVFGCGGDRDRGKRPLMGRLATELADLSVVTSDNPRSEDPLAIIEEIREGARAGSGAFTVEPDRRAAIGLALGEARAGDVVVVAGKGHETGQQFADRTIPFDDRSVVREELEVHGAAGGSAGRRA